MSILSNIDTVGISYVSKNNIAKAGISRSSVAFDNVKSIV